MDGAVEMPGIWQQAARVLVNRPVEVSRVDLSGLKTAGGRSPRGIAWRSFGKGFIAIDIDRPRDEWFKIFLHECGHLQKHWDIIPSLRPIRDRGHERREHEADGYADLWIRIADRYYGRPDVRVRLPAQVRRAPADEQKLAILIEMAELMNGEIEKARRLSALTRHR